MSSTQEVGEIFGAGAGPAHAMLRSPTVLIASIGLWGMNVYFFKLFGIDYVKVLNHDLIKLDDPEANGTNTAQQQQQQHTRRNSKGKNVARKENESNNVVEDCIRINSSGADIIDSNQEDEEWIIMGDAHEHNDAISDEITAVRLVVLSITLLLLLHSTYMIWIDWLGGGTIGAIFAFYGSFTMAIVFPLPSTRWLRHATWLVLHRAFELIRPRCHQHCCECTCSNIESEGQKLPRPIPFVDVFFADAMCSLSKVFFDWGMLLHMASYYPKPVPASFWNILIPSAFAAIPFFIRARQCLVMWKFTSLKKDIGRYQHLWNALKYSTSIFPLCLSAYQKTVMRERAHELEPALIVLLAINAGYALWWDIGMS